MKSLREIHSEYRYELLRKSNVVAVGMGYKVTDGVKLGELSLICSVTKKLPKDELSKEDLIPSKIEDWWTDVVETGIIRAFRERTDRWRPAPGGVSIGHEQITAGTLGCLVKKGGKIYILSNNHVLANSNLGKVGDQILQPGPYDGGNLTQDMIARLSEFVPIKFIEVPGDCKIGKLTAAVPNLLAALFGSRTRLRPFQEMPENRVDAAIAEPIDTAEVSHNILDLGIPLGYRDVGLEAKIKKSGRTTEITYGTVEQVGVTVQVQYSGSKIALFVDQFMAGAMSAGGDSGSAVLTDDLYLAGLLFAGSDTTTVINPIKYVFQELGVNL